MRTTTSISILLGTVFFAGTGCGDAASDPLAGDTQAIRPSQVRCPSGGADAATPGVPLADAAAPDAAPPATSGDAGLDAPSDHAAGASARFYADTSFWNTPIGASPSIDPNSSAMVQASLVANASTAGFANGAYGVPLAYATASDKVYGVRCTVYGTRSCTPGGAPVSFPIPAGAKQATGTDGHLAVAYRASDGSAYAGKELDMWQATYDAASDTWSASTVVVNDLYGWGASCAEGTHCLGAVAAGFALLGGAVLPEEIAQGHIDHALAFATPHNLSQYIACPATADDGRSPGPAIPEGARIQLDPTFDVDAQSWPAWLKIVAHAMQTYGAYDRDFGGVLSMFGVTNQNPGVASWSTVGVPVDGYDDLALLPWDRMRVLTIRSCN